VTYNFILAALGRNLPLPCIVWLSLHGTICEDIALATPWDLSQPWETDCSVHPEEADDLHFEEVNSRFLSIAFLSEAGKDLQPRWRGGVGHRILSLVGILYYHAQCADAQIKQW
jgi:hypothetical protein